MLKLFGAGLHLDLVSTELPFRTIPDTSERFLCKMAVPTAVHRVAGQLVAVVAAEIMIIGLITGVP